MSSTERLQWGSIVLETVTGGPVSEEELRILDLSIPEGLQVPALFLLVEVTSRLQKSRSSNQPLKIKQLKAEIQTASKSSLLTKNLSFAN